VSGRWVVELEGPAMVRFEVGLSVNRDSGDYPIVAPILGVCILVVACLQLQAGIIRRVLWSRLN
jgi:hypothetical protein